MAGVRVPVSRLILSVVFPAQLYVCVFDVTTTYVDARLGSESSDSSVDSLDCTYVVPQIINYLISPRAHNRAKVDHEPMCAKTARFGARETREPRSTGTPADAVPIYS